MPLPHFRLHFQGFPYVKSWELGQTRECPSSSKSTFNISDRLLSDGVDSQNMVLFQTAYPMITFLIYCVLAGNTAFVRVVFPSSTRLINVS